MMVPLNNLFMKEAKPEGSMSALYKYLTDKVSASRSALRLRWFVVISVIILEVFPKKAEKIRLIPTFFFTDFLT